jgi:hypothetical protein
VYVEVASEMAGRSQESLKVSMKDTTVTSNTTKKRDIPK